MRLHNSARMSDQPMPSDRMTGQQRRNVMGLLRTVRRPVDAQHVADALQIHVTTARFHLTALVNQGYLRRGGGIPAGGAGRPRLTYELAPSLDYGEIVALFAAHLGGTPNERKRRALRIGADLAHRTGLIRRRDQISVGDLVVETLDQLGFEIRSVLSAFGEVHVQICTCPLAEIAASAPEVVCGIQQGLIQEIVDLHSEALGGNYQVAVTPDCAAGSCEVNLLLRPSRSATPSNPAQEPR